MSQDAESFAYPDGRRRSSGTTLQFSDFSEESFGDWVESDNESSHADLNEALDILTEMAFPLPPVVGPLHDDARRYVLEVPSMLSRHADVRDQKGAVVLKGTRRTEGTDRYWAFTAPDGGGFEIWHAPSALGELYHWTKPTGEVIGVLLRRRSSEEPHVASYLLADPHSKKEDVACRWVSRGQYRVTCGGHVVLGFVRRRRGLRLRHTHVEVHVRPGVDSYLILALAFLCIGRLRTVRRSSQTLPSEVDDLEGNSVWSA